MATGPAGRSAAPCQCLRELLSYPGSENLPLGDLSLDNAQRQISSGKCNPTMVLELDIIHLLPLWEGHPGEHTCCSQGAAAKVGREELGPGQITFSLGLSFPI